MTDRIVDIKMRNDLTIGQNKILLEALSHYYKTFPPNSSSFDEIRNKITELIELIQNAQYVAVFTDIAEIE